MAPYEEDTWQVEREREDKSEMKIFFQNILEKKKRILESERKFPFTCLKSNPFLVLEEWRRENKKKKEKGKVKIKGKVKKKKLKEKRETESECEREG